MKLSDEFVNLWTTRKLINSGDRMSMAHSLEARVPFFDVDYISTAMAVNPAKKLIRKVSSSSTLHTDVFSTITIRLRFDHFLSS